jgi:RHS repeat-associated protein
MCGFFASFGILPLAATKTKYYIQGNYEKELNASGVAIRDLNYISTPAGITGVYDKVNSVMYYLLADCQGSLNVVTDLNGAIIQELSYDAYGRRRNPADWTYNNLPSSYTFERGYTMHEHMDWFGGLINMNGRVYDSKLGRFLNSDKFVQDAGNTQNYNSYSYCLNNPLKYSDPTGMKMKALPEPTPVPWSSFMDLLYGNSTDGIDDNGGGGGGGSPSPYSDPIDYKGMWNISHGYDNTIDLINNAWNATPENGQSSSSYNQGVLQSRRNYSGTRDLSQIYAIDGGATLKQFIAIVCGEATPGDVREAQATADVITNRLAARGNTLEDGNFESEIGPWVAIGKDIYNQVTSMTIDQILDPNNKYAPSIRGAIAGIVETTDYSYGAYFTNASEPETKTNWNNYFNGTFSITVQYTGTTFFRYSSPSKNAPPNKTWP